MKANILFLVFTGLLVIGCAPTPPKHVDRMPFPAELYAALPKVGDNVVTGQVYAFTPDGEKVTDVEFVRLMPITPYQEQWYRENYIGNNNISDPDPRVYDHFFTGKINGNGEYVIEGVPDGRYYIAALVKKEHKSTLPDGTIMMGEARLFLCEELAVSGGVVVKDVTNG